MRSGRLAPGVALPSTRALARELGVSRGVVVDAYAQLAAEGYLITHQGAPTRVSEAAAPPPGAAPEPADERPPRFDFRSGGPDVGCSRAARGSPRCAARCARPPTCGSTTATHAARPSCAARWRVPGPGARRGADPAAWW